jgi:demethylmenaquinone methyltransferase/2-methoxy-6-polyprenyl-1,4-benzoquinol methylase
MSYVYMKVLESAPERYDRGMRILTLGRLERVYRDVAALVEPGDSVLDLGCGTGALAVLLAGKGALVTGLDISASMLGQAARRVSEGGLGEFIELRESGVVDLDSAFPDAAFDTAVSVLVFSELAEEERAYALTECMRILRPGGRLLIADEVMPGSALGRAATWLFRLPFAILAYVLTQNTTRRVAGLEQCIAQAGFRIVETRDYLACTLKLLVADKAE